MLYALCFASLHYKCEMVFDLRIAAKVFMFSWVNFDYFLVKNDYSLVTFNYSISHLQLTFRNSQICLRFIIANILILQLVNFDYSSPQWLFK